MRGKTARSTSQSASGWCRKADRYILTQAYAVPVLWWNRIIVHNEKIKGWSMSPSHFQGTDLVEVWLDE